MIYENAKQLHNGDEVTIKRTGEVVKVISTEATNMGFWVYAMTSDGYSHLHYTEIM